MRTDIVKWLAALHANDCLEDSKATAQLRAISLGYADTRFREPVKRLFQDRPDTPILTPPSSPEKGQSPSFINTTKGANERSRFRPFQSSGPLGIFASRHLEKQRQNFATTPRIQASYQGAISRISASNEFNERRELQADGGSCQLVLGAWSSEHTRNCRTEAIFHSFPLGRRISKRTGSRSRL